MKLCIVDVETSGFDPEKDFVTELAMVVLETENQRILETHSYVIYREEPISQQITELTGLTQNNLLTGVSEDEAAIQLMGQLSRCDFIVAHNAEFDLAFLRNMVQKYQSHIITPVIDTRCDLPLDYTPKSHSLSSLCFDREIVNYFQHAALGDALMVCKLLTSYDINTIIERSQQPTLEIQAKVTFKDKDLAKAAGFHWHADTKQWITQVKQSEYSSDNYEFKTVIIGDNTNRG